MHRTLTRLLLAAAVVPLIALASATPASASADNVVITPNTAQPGATVLVQAFYTATGWTPADGEVQLTLSIPTGSAAAFALPTPSWSSGPCVLGLGNTSIVCGWTPFDATSAVRLDANLTVDSAAAAGSIAVTAVSEIASVTPDSTFTSPLLVTPAPTVSPTVTPTPTGTATPTPTSTGTDDPGTGTGTDVPTSVPAGEGPLDPPTGGSGTVWLAAFAVVGIAVAGSLTLQRRGRRQG